METQNIKERLQSRSVRNIIATVGIVLMLLIAFWAGMQIGFSKAAFSYHFGDDYYGAFGPNNIHHGMGVIPDDISAAHGVSGKIVSISLPTIVVADQDNVEKTVSISSDTIIRKLRTTISPGDLSPGDLIVVIGSPDNKTEIGATFIRVLPALQQ